MCTPSLGMETTCGSFALNGAKALKDAAVVDLLIKAGMIVIAKTNLTVRLSIVLDMSNPVLILGLTGAWGHERCAHYEWLVCCRRTSTTIFAKCEVQMANLDRPGPPMLEATSSQTPLS